MPFVLLRRMGQIDEVNGSFASGAREGPARIVTTRREAMTRGPDNGRRGRAEPLARPTRIMEDTVMPSTVLVEVRAEGLFRALDAKDEATLRAIWWDEPQATDEMTRGWVRGRPALEAYFTENLPRLSDIHSRLEDVVVSRWGDVEVETMVLHQSYVLDGRPCEVDAPTTLVWLREGEEWRLAVVHSIPVAPPSMEL